MTIRKKWAASLVIVALAFTPAAGHGSPDAPVAVAAKSCSSGYKHAVINGAHKCLRRGQYCARGADRQYHQYGYHCHKRDRNGDYHLS